MLGSIGVASRAGSDASHRWRCRRRSLYMLLHECAPIVGLWRLQGEGPRSSLIHFRWGRDGIEGVEVEPRAPLTGAADASPWARVCPARGLTTAVRVEPGGEHATVTVYGAHAQRIHRSPSAEAAAAVALPHAQVGCWLRHEQACRQAGEGSRPTPRPVRAPNPASCAYDWLPFLAVMWLPLPARAVPPSWLSAWAGGPPAWGPHLAATAPALPPAGQPLTPGHLAQGQL